MVGESVENPLKYFNDNVGSTINLLQVMQKHNVKYIVFSSTAATYGEPESVPIQENDKTFPTNPYGESKLAVEKILKWCDKAYGIKYTALRYFNAAGAHVNGKGFSVKEVIDVTRKVTGIDIKTEVAPRRAGDPATLIASSEKAIEELGWNPKYNSLETIIETAWNWHKNHVNGYEK